MNAGAPRMAPAHTADTSWDLYRGWIVGFLVILVVAGLATGLWLRFHPL